MALLGKIRNQFGWVMMGLVILGVGGFLFMDVSSIGQGGMGGQQRIVAKINGEEVLREDFEQYIENYNGARASSEQIRSQAWEDMLSDVIFRQQAQRLGLTITEQEMSDLFTGDDMSMSALVRQQFMNPGTNQVDRTAIEQRRTQYIQIDEKDPSEINQQEFEFYQAWKALEKSVASDRLASKYMGMIEKSMYAPGWMTNVEYNRNNQSFDFSFVSVLYADVPNTEVKVSDEEMTAYIKGHPKKYEREANVSIDYVVMEVSPTQEDTINYRKEMDSLAVLFKAAKNDTTFVQNQRGTMDPTFFTKDTWQDEMIEDTLFSVEKGTVVGPYMDNTGNFKVLKVLETKNVPDSVKVRHIFKRANQRDFASVQAAAVELDSLRKMLVAGEADFDSLALKHSTDGTRTKGGDLGYRGRGDAFGPRFESYIFDVGEKDSFAIVPSNEGIHLVQITGYKFPAETNKGVRIATLTKAIVPSDETADMMENKANEIMAANRSLEELRTAAKEANLRINNAASLEIHDFALGQDVSGGIAAEIIKWGHQEATAGEVSGRVFPITTGEENYVSKILIPALVSKADKGLATIEDAAVKQEVERILRNEKKAEIVRKNLEGVNTLEGVTAKYSNAQVKTASGVRYDAPFIQEIGGSEPKLLAAADKLEAGKVSAPIAGNLGVYMIQLQKKTTPPNMPDVKIARRSVMSKMIPRTPMNPNGYRSLVRDAIKDKMKIKDNRAQIY
jgi:peptidyl-prolyl cis-trans isomerase D